MLTGLEHFYGNFRDAVISISETSLVLDLGTPHRFRKELEPFATNLNAHYLAVGYRASAHFGSRNVDLDGDIQRLPIADSSVDGIICIEVIEHVQRPQAAIDEMHRILRPGGKVLLTTPFLSQYHGKPGEYDDFYRFTDDGLRWLFRDFARIDVSPLGGYVYRMLLTTVPYKLHSRLVKSPVAMRLVNFLDKRRPTRSPVRWLVWAKK